MRRDDLLEDILHDELLIGAVRLRSRWRLFAGTLGEWTLDYAAYEPGCNEVPKDFRGGLLRVDVDNADAFCAAMEPFELQPEQLLAWIAEHGPQALRLTMVVDFDRRTFVHGYLEPVEPKSNYVPAGWTGIEDDPLKHVPQEIAACRRRDPAN